LSDAEDELKILYRVSDKFQEGCMRVRAFGFLWLLLGAAVILQSTPVAAMNDIQWTDGDITIIRDVPLDGAISTTCPTYIQPTFIPEQYRTENLCMYGDAALRFATFIDEVGHRRAAVGRPYDPQMHVIQSICDAYACQYAAGTDALVTHQKIGPESIGVVIYKHVSKRIEITHDLSDRAIYTLNTAEPDFELRVPKKEFIWSPFFGVSSNGKWLAVELHGRGIARINIEDLSVRHISTLLFQYGFGRDPYVELAVSNDGRRIAVSGDNAGFKVFDVTPECGQPLQAGLEFDPSTLSCVDSSLQLWDQIYGINTVRQPRFSDDGRRLEVTVTLWTDPPRRVTFGVGPLPSESAFDYLALGDSFVSGEGEVQESSYFDPANSCHISRRSYPFLIGAMVVIPSTRVGSVACAGARMQDIANASAEYRGQGDRVPVNGLSDENQTRILSNLVPGSVTQKSFIDHYQPKVATIGIGGNDAGLMGKLRVCAMPGTCEWAVGEGLHKTANEIRRLYEQLVMLYTDLSHTGPATRLYAVGYPDIINQHGICDPITDILFDYTERVYMRESIHYLNDVIEAAAHTAGIGYIDIERSLVGGELCNGGVATAMNGLRTGNDISVTPLLPDLKVIGSESFHPTPTGHSLIASFITRAHPNIGEEDYCGNGQIRCPQLADIPGIPSYWLANVATQPGVTSYFDTFASLDTVDTRKLHVSVDAGLLLKDSQVTLEIRSEPVSLGNLKVDSKGVVEGMATLPISLKAGEHTLHLFGTRDDGESIDIYQFIHAEDGSADEQSTKENQSNTPLLYNAPPAAVTFSTVPLFAGIKNTGVFFTAAVASGNNESDAKPPVEIQKILEHVSSQIKVSIPWMAAGLGVLGLILAILMILRWAKPTG